MSIVVATCNVQQTLPRRDAVRALEQVLTPSPDVVGLQEWYPRRWTLLRPTGSVLALPGGLSMTPGGGTGDFAWCAGWVGGCVVGLRRDRFELEAGSARVLSLPGRADRDEGRFGVEAARIAVVVRCRDRLSRRPMALVGYHLVHGVQRGAGYRPDRPGLVARHRREASRLEAVVASLQDEGRDVIAMGDSNFHGFRLPRLRSAWSAGEGGPGTLGRRQVDDVHAPMPPLSVTTSRTPSDHRAVTARYGDFG